MGLEADRVEVLLLELLYKTDYSNDFDREVRVPSTPPIIYNLYISLYPLLSPWPGFPEGRHPVLWTVCLGPGKDSVECASGL